MLKDHVFATLRDQQADAALLEYAERNVGWADCAVDRIVPPFDPSQSGSPLDVGVEGFYEWVVDKEALHRTRAPVNLKGVKLTTELQAYIERKLFTLSVHV